MNEAMKTLLGGTIREWAKFAQERDRMTTVAQEVSAITRKVIQEALAYLKANNVDVTCDTPLDLKIMSVPIGVDPVVEATFPNVKTSVSLKCGAAQRTILISPNLSIAAGGGQPFPFDAFKKGIPDQFSVNAGEFLRDAFLYVARTGGKE